MVRPIEDGPKVSGKRSRTESKAARRKQLIDATIDSIAKNGISGTTMSTVTRSAGLSMGIVNFHFESKEKLFEATLGHLAEEHRDQWQKSLQNPKLSAAEKLWSIVQAEFHSKIASRKKLAVWTGFYGEARYQKAYRKIVTDIDGERWQTVADLCLELGADGDIETAEIVADTVEALFDGFCLELVLYPENLSRSEAKDRIRRYLCSVFPDHFKIPEPACKG